jgi:hypothetical protein
MILEEAMRIVTSKKLLLSFLTLLIVSANCLAQNTEAERKTVFDAAVGKVRLIDTVAGSAVGFILVPGEFFKLSTECLANGTPDDFKILLKDDNPVVRVMGLVCLSQSAPNEYAEISKQYSKDRAIVKYQIGCVIQRATVGEISQWLVKNPFYFGRKAGEYPPQV